LPNFTEKDMEKENKKINSGRKLIIIKIKK